MRGAMKRYDFDQGRQFLWGAIGGVGGSLVLGAVGFGAGWALCGGRTSDCGSAVGLLTVAGWGSGLFAGSLFAINATGGQRANGWTHVASLGGLFLGLMAVGVVSSAVFPEGASFDENTAAQNIAISATFVTLVGAAAGLGAAFGYQAAYPELRRFTVAPMVLPDGGGGLVFGGRF